MSHWTNRYWDIECLYPLLAETRYQHGILFGKMSSLDPILQQEAILEVLTKDIVSSAELEGDNYSTDQVKSAIEKWKNHSLEPSLELTRLDSTVRAHLELSHYGKKGADNTDSEINTHTYLQHIFSWATQEDSVDPIIKAAIVHLWALTDLETSELQENGGPTKAMLARSVSDSLIPQKYYSLSTQILKEKPYYESVLERTLRNPYDISEWIEWFLYCLKGAIEASAELLAGILFKHEFWIKNAGSIDNDRQRSVLQTLLSQHSYHPEKQTAYQTDTQFAKLTTTVWAEMTGCSQDTALRDIQDLIDKEILEKLPGGGRSTAYGLKDTSLGSVIGD